ncbi:hypothetical protein [Ponticaulis sp.]|uniref:hypothetical protein n=1 Tax=Ponticaulis sp. TaxID=2020902 RepID=UPI000B65D46E|nr:hypothetical protein [Ponticaulis sp.]MAI89537.1 hypothetical protein [Ponticaulis sp.]OUY00569.1 MAG: hypothetical protein CBB65_03785 [Hyphomonadaceae bacterium TMED5]|tara:strand:+ start:9642 stop:9896 length:255 start_codon:yes stop_codon:yes gene_type:complete
MSDQFWFKKRLSRFDYGRPANWKGWASLVVFVFLVAMLMQIIGAWAFGGFAPLATGVWGLALLFIVIGLFLKICNRFSPPTGEA